KPTSQCAVLAMVCARADDEIPAQAAPEAAVAIRRRRLSMKSPSKRGVRRVTEPEGRRAGYLGTRREGDRHARTSRTRTSRTGRTQAAAAQLRAAADTGERAASDRPDAGDEHRPPGQRITKG